MSASISQSRREFIARGGLFAVAASAFGTARLFGEEKKETEEEVEVSPPEDLMREHGVLKRVLLIYGEVIRRIEAGGEVPMAALLDAAKIIRSFIEDYHEKLEEEHLFPRFKKANKLTDLVEVLAQQHTAGRRLTDATLQLAEHGTKDDRRKLSETLGVFIRMYSPHEAREDTVLFPALRGIVSPNEFYEMGDEFEKKEHELFGENGFQNVVEKAAGIEKQLGIYDLAQFTPKN